MTKYRKKPVVIEAELYKDGIEDGFSCIPFVSECKWADEKGYYKQCQKCKLNIPKKPYIVTCDGHDYIDGGDWIITDINGIRYPMKPDIFEETYELVE